MKSPEAPSALARVILRGSARVTAREVGFEKARMTGIRALAAF
jgi:hypothetical protein